MSNWQYMYPHVYEKKVFTFLPMLLLTWLYNFKKVFSYAMLCDTWKFGQEISSGALNGEQPEE